VTRNKGEIMLTKTERAQLIKLQEKEKNYKPLTDDELDRIEKQNYYDRLYPPELAEIVRIWGKVITSYTPIIDNNLLLIREVRYWKGRAAKKRDRE
jgi:hypothetical protein